MRKPNPLARPIDRMRDGAGQAAIPAGFGNIVAMVPIEPRLYLIGEYGVSSGVFADHIDPQRQNPNIPQIVQRVELNYGATTPFVQNTLCTAAALLEATHLPDNFPKEAALMLALEIAQDFASISDAIAELREHESITRQRILAGEVTRKHLPSTPNLKARTEQSINQLRSVQVKISKFSSYFYPKNTIKESWAEPIKAKLSETDDPFLNYIDSAVVILNEIANCRNAMIHEDESKYLTIIDYDLNADGSFIAPTLELIHPQTPFSRRNIPQFLNGTKDRLSDLFMNFIAVFCDRNVRNFSPMFKTHVVRLPDNELRAGSPFVWDTQLVEGHELGLAAQGTDKGK